MGLLCKHFIRLFVILIMPGDRFVSFLFDFVVQTLIDYNYNIGVRGGKVKVALPAKCAVEGKYNC